MKGIILLLATAVVWASVAFVLTEMPAPDFAIFLIMGIAAFLSTGIIWAVGGSALGGHRPAAGASRRRDEYAATDKPKRGFSSASSLSDVVDTLTPDQLAALEFALRQRRAALDEDEQIALHRLTSELERAASQGNRS